MKTVIYSTVKHPCDTREDGGELGDQRGMIIHQSETAMALSANNITPN